MTLTTFEPSLEAPPAVQAEFPVATIENIEPVVPAPQVSNEFYRNVASVAAKAGWRYKTVPLGRGAPEVLDMVFPDCLGEMADRPWFRSIIRGSASVSPEGYTSSKSLTYQPIFTEKLDDKLPSFVRVYDGQHKRLSPTLNILEPHLETRTQTLHRFYLPFVFAICLGAPAIDTRTPVHV